MQIHDDPLLRKIAALGLDKAAQDGEWHAAAIKFFGRLRNAQVGLDDIFPRSAASEKKTGFRASQKKEFKKFDGRMTFGKYKGRTIRELFDLDIGYVEWLMTINCDPAIKAEIIKIGEEFK